MKTIGLSLLVLVCFFGCKKNDTAAPEDTTPAKKEMVVQISSTQQFSYFITETDTVTNDFDTKEGYDVTTLNYTFTPKPGHKVIVEAVSTPTATFTTALTYNGKALGPIVPVKDANHTSFVFNYTVPK
jgi:ABC-type phosphate/phosphonate transport system substrate-binding protein